MTPTADGAAVIAEHLSKSHPGGAVALDRVSLSIPSGMITSLVGPNGSGKSTLIGILAGAIAPSSGSATVGGDDVVHRRDAVRRRVAFVPQELALDPEMTARENLAFFASLSGLGAREAGDRLASLSASLGVGEHLDKRIAACSGGVRRRVHVAVGLIRSAPVMMVDEPFVGLDEEGARRLWELLTTHARGGGSVLLVTHELREAERRSDRVVVLAAGRVVVEGTPSSVVARQGRRVLEVQLENAASPRLVERIATTSGVLCCALRGTHIVADVEAGSGVAGAVLDALRDVGAVVLAYRVEEPSLAGVCRRLAAESSDAAARDGACAPARGGRRGSGTGGGGGGGGGGRGEQGGRRVR